MSLTRSGGGGGGCVGADGAGVMMGMGMGSCDCMEGKEKGGDIRRDSRCGGGNGDGGGGCGGGGRGRCRKRWRSGDPWCWGSEGIGGILGRCRTGLGVSWAYGMYFWFRLLMMLGFLEGPLR